MKTPISTECGSTTESLVLVAKLDQILEEQHIRELHKQQPKSETAGKITRPSKKCKMSDEMSEQSKQNQDEKKKDATTPLDTNCYNKWPEYKFNPEDFERTFPPRDVVLSNYNVSQICSTKLCIADCCSRYPHDFDSRGIPLKEQTSRGHVMYCHNSKGELCFAVVCGTTQLHGDLGRFQGLDA